MVHISPYYSPVLFYIAPVPAPSQLPFNVISNKTEYQNFRRKLISHFSWGSEIQDKCQDEIAGIRISTRKNFAVLLAILGADLISYAKERRTVNNGKLMGVYMYVRVSIGS